MTSQLRQDIFRENDGRRHTCPRCQWPSFVPKRVLKPINNKLLHVLQRNLKLGSAPDFHPILGKIFTINIWKRFFDVETDKNCLHSFSRAQVLLLPFMIWMTTGLFCNGFQYLGVFEHFFVLTIRIYRGFLQIQVSTDFTPVFFSTIFSNLGSEAVC